MNLRMLLISIVSISLLTCGSKKEPEKKEELPKDSLKTQYEIPDNPNSNTQQEEKVIDSIDITTNTEILNEKGQLDPNSSPIAVVQTIIKAAKTGKYGLLLKLSNPAIDMDGDAKDIINVPNKSKENQKEFNDFFGSAKIMGNPRIKKNLAEVDIETSAEGGTKETIICENKFEKWYLKGL